MTNEPGHEANRSTRDRSQFALAQLVQQVASTLSPEARAKQLDLLCRVDPNLPAALRGDAGRLSQLLAELVSSAIAIAEHGSVVLNVELAQETESAVVVRFEVTDSGSGRACLVQAFAHSSASPPCRTLPAGKPNP